MQEMEKALRDFMNQEKYLYLDNEYSCINATYDFKAWFHGCIRNITGYGSGQSKNKSSHEKIHSMRFTYEIRSGKRVALMQARDRNYNHQDPHLPENGIPVFTKRPIGSPSLADNWKSIHPSNAENERKLQSFKDEQLKIRKNIRNAARDVLAYCEERISKWGASATELSDWLQYWKTVPRFLPDELSTYVDKKGNLSHKDILVNYFEMTNDEIEQISTSKPNSSMAPFTWPESLVIASSEAENSLVEHKMVDLFDLNKENEIPKETDQQQAEYQLETIELATGPGENPTKATKAATLKTMQQSNNSTWRCDYSSCKIQ